MSPARQVFASLFLLGAVSAAHAADAPPATPPNDSRSSSGAPVAQPETDPAMSNSGALVPGQPIRPEGNEEASVPKTPLDKSAAGSADVGTRKTNDKSKRPGSGGDGSVSPSR